MSLSTSLLSAISGLQAQQTLLDVVSANVANVNTDGYKSATVSFADLLSQTAGGAGASGLAQVGLGVQVNAITPSQGQGPLAATGVPTDLAINGSGYFVTQTGGQTTYTRDGGFRFDGTGRLVNATGAAVMGWSAATPANDPLGALSLNASNPAAIGPISIPAGYRLPARQTSTLSLGGNLDAGATAANLVNSQGQPGTVQLTIVDGAGGTTTPIVGQDTLPMTAVDSLGNQHKLSMTLTNLSGTQIPGAAAGMVYDNNTWTWTVNTDPADSTVHLALDNSTYTDPVSGQQVRASSSGLVNFNTNGSVNYVTYQDRNAEHFGTNPAGTQANDPNIPGGNPFPQPPGVPGAWAAAANADVANRDVIGFSGATVPAGAAGPAFFNTQNFALTRLPIVLAFQNVPAGSPLPPAGTTAGTLVNMNVGGTGLMQSWYTQSVSINFGTPSTITAANVAAAGAPGDSGNGLDYAANPTGIASLNNGLRDGLTQDASGVMQNTAYLPRSTARLDAQDGSVPATLQSLSVDQAGRVVGAFSDGRQVVLAQVAVATFANPGGLARAGDNGLVATANSGIPEIGVAGQDAAGSIVSGFVEQSDVDLLTQMTNMLIGQRSFEADARLITASDRTTETLINMTR